MGLKEQHGHSNTSVVILDKCSMLNRTANSRGYQIPVMGEVTNPLNRCLLDS